MMRSLIVVLCCSLTFAATAQDLAAGSAAPATHSALSAEKQAEALIQDIYTASYRGQDEKVTNFEADFFNKVENPYPYIYALWFNEAVLGAYGKKDNPHQLQLIERILNTPNAQGTIKTSAYYQKALHHLFSADPATAISLQQNIGSIRNWQLVGPFENISHSGFHKNYGPLDHPEPQAEFTSATKAKIKWFVPSKECRDGWIAMPFYFSKNTAVIYAQTFVNSPAEQDVYFNLGGAGAMKAWINDALVFSDETERVTEFDAYTVQTKLKKGVNRILIQLSFTESNYANFALRLTDKNYNDVPGLKGSNVYKAYTKSASLPSTPIPHFAEDFFSKKNCRRPFKPRQLSLAKRRVFKKPEAGRGA